MDAKKNRGLKVARKSDTSVTITKVAAIDN